MLKPNPRARRRLPKLPIPASPVGLTLAPRGFPPCMEVPNLSSASLWGLWITQSNMPECHGVVTTGHLFMHSRHILMRPVETPITDDFRERGLYELRRILLPRSRVNRRKKEGEDGPPSPSTRRRKRRSCQARNSHLRTCSREAPVYITQTRPAASVLSTHGSAGS
jgi:hypothetical protein